MTILELWVSNQPIVDDNTAGYITATNWRCPAGCILDRISCTLSGPCYAVWDAYTELRAAVAQVGHGPGCDDLPAPALTACPQGLEGAAAAMARLESLEAESWDDFGRNNYPLYGTVAYACENEDDWDGREQW